MVEYIYGCCFKTIRRKIGVFSNIANPDIARGVIPKDLGALVLNEEKLQEAVLVNALDSFMIYNTDSGLYKFILSDGFLPYDRNNDVSDEVTEPFFEKYLERSRQVVRDLRALQKETPLEYKDSFLGNIGYAPPAPDLPHVPPETSSEEAFNTLRVIAPLMKEEKLLEMVKARVSNCFQSRFVPAAYEESFMLAEIALEQALSEK